METEVQTSSLYRQQNKSNYACVKDLKHCLQLFGYTLDDRIERRELVIIFRSVSNEMEREIAALAQSSKYNEAKEMRLTGFLYIF